MKGEKNEIKNKTRRNLVFKISHLLKTSASKKGREYILLLSNLAITSWAKIMISYKCVLVENAQILIIIYVIEPATIVILNLFYIF